MSRAMTVRHYSSRSQLKRVWCLVLVALCVGDETAQLLLACYVELSWVLNLSLTTYKAIGARNV